MKIFLLFLSIAAAQPAFAADSPEPMRNFTLPSLAGESVSLNDFRGSWVVVNFWATWCAPCRKEIPELAALHRDRGDVVVLGIAYEDSEASVFEMFLREYQPGYPILLPDVYDMPDALEVPRVLPTTLVVNPAGYKVRSFYGPVTREMLEEVFTVDDESTGAAL